MRTFTSIVALLAALGTAAAPVLAQDVSPDLAQRLRAAVAQAEPTTSPLGAVTPASGFSTSTLNHLVAPIALYPDALLAQVLVASTFPDQVSDAGNLIARAPSLSDGQLSDAIAAGNWDPSILVLVSGFPSVVERMSSDMDWTRELGSAVAGDDSGVMAAVQTMRSEALSRGNLVSNRAQVVNRDSSGISIRPADPEVVYVPQYDPDVVYETRDAVYTGPQPATTGGVNPFVAGALGFGAGLLVANLWHDHHHDNDNNNNNAGWPAYWQRNRVFDWNGGTFYPRPGPNPAPWMPPPPHSGPGLPPPPPPPVAGRGPGMPPPPPVPGRGPGQPPPPPTTAGHTRPPEHRPQQDTNFFDDTGNPVHHKPRKPPQPDTGFFDTTGTPPPHKPQPAPPPGNAQHPSPRQAAGPQRAAPDDAKRPSPEACKRHPDNPACHS